MKMLYFLIVFISCFFCSLGFSNNSNGNNFWGYSSVPHKESIVISPDKTNSSFYSAPIRTATAQYNYDSVYLLRVLIGILFFISGLISALIFAIAYRL